MATYQRRVAMFGTIQIILLFVHVTSGRGFPPDAQQNAPNDKQMNKPGFENEHLNKEFPAPNHQQQFQGLNPQVQPGQGKNVDMNKVGGIGGVLGGHLHQPVVGKVPKGNPPMGSPAGHIKIAETDECKEDVHRLCSSKTIKTHNFAILDCLQSDLDMEKTVSEKCQHFVWKYKHNLTKDDRFEAAGKEVCRKALAEISECGQLEEGNGERIPCLIEFMDNITEPGCHQFLNKMAKIVFSDYRLVWHFMQNCNSDVEKLSCGRIESDDGGKLHSQGKTLLCLAKHVAQLEPQCKKQVLRVAELQSDDYHLDRPLFYACRESRELFCEDVHAGSGKVFECLFKHKNDKKMGEQCSKMLTVRQKMMAEDIRVDKSFFRACHGDMVQHKCFKKNGEHEDASRSRVLLCLENAIKLDQKVSGECRGQMTYLRRQLMSDYEATPEIVAKCSVEIEMLCEGGLKRGGKTIHCLMKNAELNKQKNFGVECRTAIENLLRETLADGDFTVDRVLQEACAPVLKAECKGVPGNGVINCLMEKVDSDDMTDECEDHLLEIQYFMVRDFSLDPELYMNCHKDAQNLCSAPKNWFDDSVPTAETSGYVFSCLYRHMKQKEHKLTDGCASQVRKAMRRRAKRIELEPAIEENCLQDLGAFCSDLDSYKKGTEISCLQDNFDNLSDKCQEAIEEFTEDEDEDLNLDTILMKACTPMIKRFCSDELDQNAEASMVMNCLIAHKHHRDMDDKCAAGVEHHQIIQLKDFKFNHAFKEACREDVPKLCGDKKNKTAVIVCLSEAVRKNILLEEDHEVSRKCRQQLRIEILQRGESIKLDPRLQEACKEDVKELCKIDRGNARVTECLKNHQQKLSKSCHRMLFKRQQDEAIQGADFLLFKECKSMIKMHCQSSEGTDILDCLKTHKNQDGFDANCRAVVMKRTLQETKDFRLNPSLAKSCRLDIPKFCKDVVNSTSMMQAGELEGKVINCLKMHFVKKRLSHDCHMEIRLLVKEVQKDINMDPVLLHACQVQIHQFCGKELSEHEDVKDTLVFRPSDNGDKVVECLEQKLMDGKIEQNSQCAREVRRIVEEAHVDVNIDPHLYSACTDDLVRWCRDIESGEGKKMSCLLSVLEDYPDKMNPKCNKLLAQRKTLWEFAAKSAPAESLSDLSQQVMQSPAKSYLVGLLLTIVGIIFIVGITCGRVTKRVTAERKDR